MVAKCSINWATGCDFRRLERKSPVYAISVHVKRKARVRVISDAQSVWNAKKTAHALTIISIHARCITKICGDMYNVMFLSPEISKIAFNKAQVKLNERQKLSNCFSVRILNWHKGPIELSKIQTFYWVLMANCKAIIVKLNLRCSRGKQNSSKTSSVD